MNILLFPDMAPVRKKLGIAMRLRWPTGRIEAAASPEDLLSRANLANLVFLTVEDAAAAEQIAEIARSLSSRTSTGIIVLAKRPTDEEMLDMLEAGADDYLASTVRVTKLVGRIFALQRRIAWSGQDHDGIVRCGPLNIWSDRHEVTVGGRPLLLTPTEFKLLYHLAMAHGNTLTIQTLQKLIWDADEPLYLNSLRQYVQRLRNKLQTTNENSVKIVAIRGIGYRLAYQSVA
jgi:DNA-binding response OmpR family regulator